MVFQPQDLTESRYDRKLEYISLSDPSRVASVKRPCQDTRLVGEAVLNNLILRGARLLLFKTPEKPFRSLKYGLKVSRDNNSSNHGLSPVNGSVIVLVFNL